MAKELNPRQQLFVQHYLESGNATDALIKAGYKTKWPDKIAYRLLNQPLIKEAVGKCRAKVEKKTAITLEWIINKHREIVENEATPPQVKINALSEITEIMDFYPPEKTINTNTNYNIDDRTKFIVEDTQIEYQKLQTDTDRQANLAH